MNEQQRKTEIFNVVWRACDTFRGVIDPSMYKDYILTMLFVKYLSDIRKSKLAEFEKKYSGDKVRIERAMARERFIVSEEASFDYLYAHRNDNDIGQTINTVLENIEDANKAKLHNVFRNIDFNSEANLGQTRQRNNRLKNLLEDLAALDLRPDNNGHMDIIGDVYEYLIARFAASAGKKAGEFYTPAEVSETLARLVAPQKGDRICDPACGSGSLLIRAAKQVGSNDFSLYGQEMNGSTWALCKMNMFLHEVDSAHIEWEDTIRHPQFVEDDALMKFDIVIANPPFTGQMGPGNGCRRSLCPLPARYSAQEQRRLGLYLPHAGNGHGRQRPRRCCCPPRGAVPRRAGRQNPRSRDPRKSLGRRHRSAGQPVLRHRHSCRPDDLRQIPQTRQAKFFLSTPAVNLSRAPTRTSCDRRISIKS